MQKVYNIPARVNLLTGLKRKVNLKQISANMTLFYFILQKQVTYFFQDYLQSEDHLLQPDIDHHRSNCG